MNTLHSPPRARFAEKAKSYDAHAKVQAEAAEWLAQWLPPESTCTEVLELGAGTGLFTQHLASQYPNATCTDVSQEMLAVCQERVSGLNYSIQDAWQPLPKPGTWDLITACSLLQWAPDPLEVVNNWAHALATDGRILTAFFIAPTLPEMEVVMGGTGPVQWRSTAQWQDIFTSVGLRIERFETDSRCYTFASAMHFWKAIHGTGATVSRRIKPSALLRFFRDYEDRFPDPKGVYSTWTFCRAELIRA
ncbi:MAG: hypothetical protein CNE95_00195 [Puniceicoccaceae bacterium MED-G30]|nr:MAG: hypothetical protein CNE95_00195 [Puniceicoccaceae bacterium MED-G30]|tara:strand:- start:6803 stop:7546 length:744 start_codon:yes stop_codon:yes gene_type:complete